MSKVTSLASKALIMLAAGATLAGCYQSDAKLFEAGVSLPIPASVSCDFDGNVVTYDIARSGGAYIVTDADNEDNVVDAVFVRSVNPFVYVVQVSDTSSVYYTTVNVLTWRLTKMKDDTDPLVVALAAAHGVTADGGFPTKIEGDEDDMRSFLKNAADLGSVTMAKCKPT
jgi:hypothetical protein